MPVIGAGGGGLLGPKKSDNPWDIVHNPGYPYSTDEWTWGGDLGWIMTPLNPLYVAPWPYPPLPDLSGSPAPAFVNAQAALRSGSFIVPGTSMPLIYGQQRVVGQIIWASTGDTNQADFWVAIGEGPIDSIVTTFLNGISAGSYLNYAGSPTVSVTLYNGTSGQSEDTGLAAVSGMQQSGMPRTAYAHITVSCITGQGPAQPWWYNFANSGYQLNEISFEVKGVKVAPNGDGSGTPAWSDNFALCLRDWLCDSVHGCAIPSAMLNGTNFDTAAAACTSLGYKLNTVLTDNASTAIQQYDALRVCANAELYMDGGKLCLFIDQPQSSVVVAFDTTTNCGPVSYEPLSLRNAPTRVVLNYSNAADWPSYAPGQNDPNLDPITVDNPGITLGTVPLRVANYTIDGITGIAQAQKVASYLLNQGTVSMRYRFTVGWVGVLVTRGSYCTLTTDDGLSAQAILVQDVTRKDSGGYEIVARQYDSTVYSSAAISGDTPPTNTNPKVTDTPPDITVVDCGYNCSSPINPGTASAYVVVSATGSSPSATQISRIYRPRVDYTLPNYLFSRQLRIRYGTTGQSWATMGTAHELPPIPLQGNLVPLGAFYSLFADKAIAEADTDNYNPNGTFSYTTVSGGGWAIIVRLENTIGLLSTGVTITQAGSYSSTGTPGDAGALVVAKPLEFIEQSAPAVSASGKGIVYEDSTTHLLMASLNGGAYAALGSGGSGPSYADNETASGTQDGSNVTFTLAHTPSPAASLIGYLQGQMLYTTADFTLSGSTITMVTAPVSTDRIRWFYRY